MSLGQFIRSARRSRGLSQWELAQISGLGRSYISRLELDDYEYPSAKTFLALSKALRVTVNDLYEAAGYFDEISEYRTGQSRSQS